MMFRWNFIIRIATEVVWLWISILFWQVMYGFMPAIAGWTKYEVYFLIGTAHIVHQAFEGFFFPNCHRIPEDIRLGNMDFYLTKPINSQFMASTRYIDLGSLANVVLGFVIVIYAWLHLQIQFSFLHLLLFFILLINGMMVYYTIMFTLMTLSFWIIRAEGLIGVYFNLTSFSRQPADIYRGILKFFLTFCFPMIITINFPTQVMIRTLSFHYMIWGIFITALFVYGTHKFWNYGVNHYRSASS
jgi:ABC-2 type transport system permease protein